MKKVLGIDLGGMSAKVGVVNQYGEIEKDTIIKNASENLISNLVEKIKIQLENWGYDFDLDIERIGFAAPGFIDHERGIIKLSGNLNLRNFDLKSELEKAFNFKKIYILNDANAAALGEFWTGAASTYNTELFYTIGTGIGGAIVVDGKLISGEHGFAGEFGHGGFMQDDYECTCGLKTCLEPVSSASGIARKFKKILQENPQHPAAKYFNFGKKFDLEAIAKIYAKNKKPYEIKSILKEILKPLISHMSLMVFALDPKAIIIGGGGSHMGEDLLEILKEELQPMLLPFYKNDLAIKTAKLGNKSGIIGAAYYAINHWYE